MRASRVGGGRDDQARLVLKPRAITVRAEQALPGARAALVGVHRHGVAVRGEGQRDVVWLSPPGDGLVPLHVVVDADDLDAIAALEGDGTTVALDLAGVRRLDWHCVLDPALASPSGYDALAPVVRAFADQWTGLSATVREIVDAARWRAAFDLEADPVRATATLRALIGRGAGSTPAGDDLVIGALAFVLAAQGPDAPLALRVRALDGELDALTTATGATYLRAALDGRFGSHLSSFVAAVGHVPAAALVARAERVAGHGGTSGTDTLAGFLAAARGWRMQLARGR